MTFGPPPPPRERPARPAWQGGTGDPQPAYVPADAAGVSPYAVASFKARVGGRVLDWVVFYLAAVVLAQVSGFHVFAALVVQLGAFAVQGFSGYTPGKAIVGIRLVGVRTGEPVGVIRSEVRWVCHALDWLSLGYGWIRPLRRRNVYGQTFGDSCVRSTVVRARS